MEIPPHLTAVFHYSTFINIHCFLSGKFGNGTTDSELHNFNSIIYAFTSSKTNLVPFGALLPNLAAGATVRLCITIKKGVTYITTGGDRALDRTLSNPGLFSSLTPLYVGINQVISADHQNVEGAHGDGLCKAVFTWSCDDQ